MANDCPAPSPDWQSPARLVVILAVYTALTVVMIWWAHHTIHIVEVWFANAVLVALLLRGMLRSVPLTLALGLIGSMLANMLMHKYWLTSLGLGAANMSEVAAAIACTRLPGLRLQQDKADERYFLNAMIALVVLAPAIGALVGATVIRLTLHSGWAHSFVKWWVGDAMGLLILLPPMLAYSHRRLRALFYGASARMFWGTLLLSMSVTMLSMVLFESPFIVFSIPLLFAAYRLGVFGTALACTSNIIIIFIMVALEGQSWVPRLRGLEKTQAMGIAFYAAMTVVGPLLISIVISQRKRMSREIEEISSQLKVVTDNVPALIGQVDAHLRYCFANSKFQTFYGKPAAEILGKTPCEIFGDEYGGHIERYMHQALLGTRQHYPMTTPQGRRLEVTLEPQRDRDNAVIGLFVLAQDVSEKLELESRLREITDNVPALIAYLDDQLIYHFANERYEELWGIPSAELIGKSSAAIAGECYAAVIEPRQRACLDGQHVEQELHLDDGRVIDMTYVPHLIDGRVRGIYTLGIDITARKDAEAMLFEAMDKSQMMLDSIGDAVIACDVKLRVTMMNPVASQMTGWSEEDALGRPFVEVVRLIDMESGKASLNPLEVAIREDRAVALQMNSKLARKDSSETAVEDSAAPIHSREGTVIGGIMVLHDVSEARLMALKMSHLAQHDHLTDLPNRVLLHALAGPGAPARGGPRCRTVHRPGSLQAHQRLARPPRRRSRIEGSRQATASGDPCRRHGQSPGWRRIRDPAEPAGRRTRCRTRGEKYHCHHRTGHWARWTRVAHLRQHRHRHLPRRCARPEEPDEAGGHRALPRQAERTRWFQLLHPADERTGGKTPGARTRFAPWSAEQRAVSGLSAEVRSALRQGDRHGGAGALASERWQRGVAGPVHSAGGGNRPDHPDRYLGDA